MSWTKAEKVAGAFATMWGWPPSLSLRAPASPHALVDTAPRAHKSASGSAIHDAVASVAVDCMQALVAAQVTTNLIRLLNPLSDRAKQIEECNRSWRIQCWPPCPPNVVHAFRSHVETGCAFGEAME